MPITARHFVGEGDLLPSLELSVTSEKTGLDFDFTNWNSPVFFMRRKGSTIPTINGITAILQNPTTAPQLRYDFNLGDTNEAGVYEAKFQVLDPNDRPASFPNDGYIEVTVLRKVGS